MQIIASVSERHTSEAMDLGTILPLARKRKQGLPEFNLGLEHGTKKPG
jgi:hypothetical protein